MLRRAICAIDSAYHSAVKHHLHHATRPIFHDVFFVLAWESLTHSALLSAPVVLFAVGYLFIILKEVSHD